MTRESGDCKPVRENGSAYCSSTPVLAFPKACLNLHAEYTAHAIDHRCVVSHGWNKTLPPSLPPCMERRRGFDGTAADPCTSRRLYGIALSRRPSYLPLISRSDISNDSPTDVATSVWLFSFHVGYVKARDALPCQIVASPLSYFTFCHVCTNFTLGKSRSR